MQKIYSRKYDELREDCYSGLEGRYFLDFDKAEQAKLVIDFDAHSVAPTPNQLGVNDVENVSLEDIVPNIDWNTSSKPGN